MRRAIALFGILALASQTALGSAGALFLCLCQDAATHDSPCEPAESALASSACRHDAQAEPAADGCESCNDVLIDAADIDSLGRLADYPPIKSPLLAFAFSFVPQPEAGRPAVSRPLPARAPPLMSGARAHYAQTVRLLR